MAPWADVAYGCDGKFWRAYEDKLRLVSGERWTLDKDAAAELGLHWIEGVDGVALSQSPKRIFTGGNSGYQAIGLAFLWGAARIILLGYDMQRGPGGRVHWHADHPPELGNPGGFDQWIARFKPMAADLRQIGVSVVNATRQTALDAFPRVTLEDVLAPRRPLLVEGMSGLGDNLHQRALVKEWVKTRDVWLRTPWPSAYEGIGGLHFLRPNTSLRTQQKNAIRESAAYGAEPSGGTQTQRIWYSHPGIRKHGGFLKAMAAESGAAGARDFSLTVPHEWMQRAGRWLARWNPTKPLMLVRPLVERKEWGGCSSRNPDFAAYHALADAIRSRYFVVSVADLKRGVEWQVGTPLKADVECHGGELEMEVLAALFAQAALVYCSPGFALILAQAVNAPVCCVFGGHECGSMYERGAPTDLLIDPVKPCGCLSQAHNCNKLIDIPAAIRRLQEFTRNVTPQNLPVPA